MFLHSFQFVTSFCFVCLQEIFLVPFLFICFLILCYFRFPFFFVVLLTTATELLVVCVFDTIHLDSSDLGKKETACATAVLSVNTERVLCVFLLRASFSSFLILLISCIRDGALPASLSSTLLVVFVLCSSVCFVFRVDHCLLLLQF